LRDDFLHRLSQLSILDPACGSGNFLYLSLQGIKDIENRVVLECEAMGLPPRDLGVGPEILHGIEINALAAELARTTIWIGDIQWGIRNGIYARPEPILRPLHSIECRDALLTPDGKGGFREAEWPDADFIVGNPPFLGGKLLRRGLGDETVDTLFRIYDGRVPAEADLVCYWFGKAWEAVEADRAKRVGLVATNSIRGGANRKLLEPIAERNAIFEAWSDEPWTIDGAAVRVSLVCFGQKSDSDRVLNGIVSNAINADLTGTVQHIASATRLTESSSVSFMGDIKVGPFDVPGAVARLWLDAPLNPNRRPNSDVLRPWVNALDVVRRPRDMWIVDFGSEISEAEASCYEAPFAYLLESVKPKRDANRDIGFRTHWWRHGRPRPEMWAALGAGLGQDLAKARYSATARVAKHRLFVWLPNDVCPDSQIIVIARDDDTTFGILHSRFHEAWSLRLGTWLGVGNDPRYTPTTTFETFPFPEGLTPNIPAADYADDPRAEAIAAAAKTLDELRRAWLNPPDLVDIAPEITPTAAPGEAPRRYPDRIVPKTAGAAVKLKQRTLTNLYNERPHWLADAHEALDRTVASAYGWPEDIAIEDALAKLLSLNLERAKAEASP
jgi:type II restriction/modification system DNA methylase subunit YeeA